MFDEEKDVSAAEHIVGSLFEGKDKKKLQKYFLRGFVKEYEWWKKLAISNAKDKDYSREFTEIITKRLRYTLDVSAGIALRPLTKEDYSYESATYTASSIRGIEKAQLKNVRIRYLGGIFGTVLANVDYGITHDCYKIPSPVANLFLEVAQILANRLHELGFSTSLLRGRIEITYKNNLSKLSSEKRDFFKKMMALF